MKLSTVFRQFAAAFVGIIAWKYFYAVDPFAFSYQWAGLLVAAFVIGLVTAYISKNILLGHILIIGVYLAYGPGFTWSVNQLVPMIGGVISASAIWKIIL